MDRRVGILSTGAFLCSSTSCALSRPVCYSLVYGGRLRQEVKAAAGPRARALGSVGVEGVVRKVVPVGRPAAGA